MSRDHLYLFTAGYLLAPMTGDGLTALEVHLGLTS